MNMLDVSDTAALIVSNYKYISGYISVQTTTTTIISTKNSC